MPGVNHSERAHARLSASGSSKWLNCLGSVGMESCIEQQLLDAGKELNASSAFAQEGTCAHELGDLSLTHNKTPDEWLGETLEGVEVDEDMVEHIQGYVDFVRSFDGDLFVERRVDFSNFIPDGFGTADAIVFSGNKVHVIDLKYGSGIAVSAYKNTQGLLYGLGVVNDFDFLYDFDTVVIHIYQPRKNNFSEYEIGKSELLEWGEWASKRANIALQPNAPFAASDKACQWCMAKPVCKPLAVHTMEVITSEFEDIDPQKSSNVMTDEEMGRVIDNKKLIESWLKSVEAEVKGRLETGTLVKGYKLVAGRSIRVLKQDSIPMLEREYGAEIYKPKVAKGVGDLEKLIGKKRFLELDVTFKSTPKSTIAPESDKRPAVETIVDDFKDL